VAKRRTLAVPWDAKSFAKHNRKLKGPALSKAAAQATAMVKSGVDEGTAIATANKTGNKMQRKKSPLYDHPRSRRND
jgi:uncharacterized protein YdaT